MGSSRCWGGTRRGDLPCVPIARGFHDANSVTLVSPLHSEPTGTFPEAVNPPVRATGSLWGTDKERRVPCGHWEIPAVVGAAVLPASPQSSAEMNREQCFPNLSLFSTDVAAFQQRQHLAACWEGRGWGFLQVRCCRGCAKRRLAPALSVSAAALPGLAGTRGAVAAMR